MRLHTSSVASLLASFTACAPAAAQEPIDLSGSTYVSAKLLNRSNPDYPAGALHSGKEGWVMLSFVISPTGDVTEPMIEDSSGIEAFEQAALRAVQHWKYTPATLDGTPVEQAMVKSRIFFQIESSDAPGASPSFISKYRRIVRATNDGDFAAAAELITELEFGERKNLYEDAWFWWTKYFYLAASGSTDAAEMRRCLQRAIGYQQEYLAPDLFVAAAERLVVAHARALDLSAAIATFERLRDAPTARRSDNYEEAVARLQPSYERLLAVVNGDDLLVTNGTVGEFDYWVHDLVRRSFSFADIEGRLDALDIRCQRGTRRYNAVPSETIWTVPESWGACGAYVKGEPGATFAFREYPRSFVPPTKVDVAAPAAALPEPP
jgi:TonB family protein